MSDIWERVRDLEMAVDALELSMRAQEERHLNQLVAIMTATMDLSQVSEIQQGHDYWTVALDDVRELRQRFDAARRRQVFIVGVDQTGGSNTMSGCTESATTLATPKGDTSA